MQKALLFKIKSEHLNEWKDWCKKLKSTLNHEAVLSMQEEKLIQEICLIFEINGDSFGIGYMEGEGLPANMDREINRIHKEMKKKCIVFMNDVEIAYNIKA